MAEHEVTDAEAAALDAYSRVVTQVAATLTVMLWSFAANRFWTFGAAA